MARDLPEASTPKEPEPLLGLSESAVMARTELPNHPQKASPAEVCNLREATVNCRRDQQQHCFPSPSTSRRLSHYRSRMHLGE